jgi:sigma-B regulation protein RsbU (phosphoserine phosphatase)
LRYTHDEMPVAQKEALAPAPTPRSARPPKPAKRENFVRRTERAIFARIGIRAPEGIVERSFLRLSLTVLLVLFLRFTHIWRSGFADVLLFCFIAPLVIFGIILLYRWIFRHLLWRVRNRLVVTYLLMGLAPVVLFVTLALIAAYLFCGQFATFAASAELIGQELRLSSENRGFTIHVSHVVRVNPKVDQVELPELEEAGANEMVPHSLETSAFSDGHKIQMVASKHVMGGTLTQPNWVHGTFHGLVLDSGKLFFRAVDSDTIDGHTVTLVSSIPVSNSMLEQMAKNLGRISIIPGFSHLDDDDDDRKTWNNPRVRDEGDHKDQKSLAGGKLPERAHFYDRQVDFAAPLEVVDWSTGDHETSRLLLHVTSRPTLLYERLFGSSVQLGEFVRNVLISIGIVFGLLELFAFAMAIGLNRTITRSINDLYTATKAIDRGNFEHRIAVKRKDQLAALSTSFNAMSASLAHLLEQQREKERLQAELTIAHEVQNSLLPQGQVRLPLLEVHGVSKAARGVSGDYYDFLLTGASQLALALGDISGKGISAALLMASLHSAVRAYRFGESGGAQLLDGEANLLANPALMLERLNRHLYTSTQPEKYATLFLAHYDGSDQSLTYSTGGQLPPLVLCANNEVKRLDCGGSVVGLLPDMKYEQATINMSPGDILIIYSDGVTEPENEFGDFGEDRLLDLVKRNRAMSLEGISNIVMQALTTWIGDQEQPDDITLVLARQL